MEESMLDFLRAELVRARLRQDHAWVKAVSTAIDELERNVGKDFVSRDEMVAWAKSQIKATEKSRSEAALHGIEFEADPIFMELMHSMIPSQMTEDEIYEFFTKECGNSTNLGELMKELKTRKAGLYDGKLASAVAKSVLPYITK